MTQWRFEHISHAVLTPELTRLASLPLVDEVLLGYFRRHSHRQQSGSVKAVGQGVKAYAYDGSYNVDIIMTEQTEAARNQVVDALSGGHQMLS